MRYVIEASKKFSVGYCVTCGEKCANRCDGQTGCTELVK